jgi:hypothetical protein
MTGYDNLPYVEAELNYLAPITERPRYYAYDPGPGVPRSSVAHEAHRVRIHDMRPIQSQISLDREGFALLEQRSAVQDFWDEDQIRRIYYPEAEQLIASATGASRVFIFDHTLRRRIPGVIDRSRDAPRQPATYVHVDHTAKSGPQRVRDLLGGEAEELLRGRVQVINPADRCAMRRLPCATPRPWPPPISCRPISSTATGSVRPIRSPSTRRIAGSTHRICGRTRRCC